MASSNPAEYVELARELERENVSLRDLYQREIAAHQETVRLTNAEQDRLEREIAEAKQRLADTFKLLDNAEERGARGALSAIRATEPTEDEVRLGAKVIAESPLIDAPKLPFPSWMGLSRSILQAALAWRYRAAPSSVARSQE